MALYSLSTMMVVDNTIDGIAMKVAVAYVMCNIVMVVEIVVFLLNRLLWWSFSSLLTLICDRHCALLFKDF